ncbi:MAG: RsfS/YbeB/iojap family protein, partial [Synergistaceae bacterium]|nr:RsfS/YbeB/iojap family protein [Synergistaceae bacterium]
ADSSNWRLVDAGDVIVHVFSRKGREFYRLEKLWADARVTEYHDEREDREEF